VVLKSCAKLNLYLKILAKRRDGYHNLETIFERIDLADRVILKSRRDNRIKINTDSALIPKGRANLALRAATLLKNNFKVRCGADIKIIKRIPVAAGLGGGSSNAASVLVGLNKLWRLRLSRKKLISLGKSLGADVPFFIHNSSFARGRGKGDRVFSLKSLSNTRFWHILVVPRSRVSTASAYQKWDKIAQKVRLTSPDSNVNILISALKRKDFSLISKGLFNSLEEASIKLYPEIRRIKERLSSLGLQSILMSGSGPAVFGMVSSRKEAQSLGRQLKANRFWRIYITRTI
jgi:4-diphosphocytidyl-2-C-methyl-D-erythritol kinase